MIDTLSNNIYEYNYESAGYLFEITLVIAILEDTEDESLEETKCKLSSTIKVDSRDEQNYYNFRASDARIRVKHSLQ